MKNHDYGKAETRTKVCTRCKTRKTIQAFCYDGRATDRRSCWCNACRNTPPDHLAPEGQFQRLAERRAAEWVAAGLVPNSLKARMVAALAGGDIIPASEFKAQRAVAHITPAVERQHLRFR